MWRRFLNQPLWVRALRGVVLALLLSVIASFVPTPYQLEAPGRASPVGELILIKDPRAKPVNGRFLMTTVLLEPATVMMCVYGLLDPQAILTLRREYKSGVQAQTPGSGLFQMELSQYLSSRVALQELGYSVRGKEVGLLVQEVSPLSSNLGVLRRGDLIVSAAGSKGLSLRELLDRVEGLAKDEKLLVEVRRGNSLLPLELSATQLSGKKKKRLGVLLHPVYDDTKLPVQISFKQNNTVGASAGLIFALEIYDELSSEDIAKGRIIAGTGTLNAFGVVGGIEGITFKIVGAERAGASVFLVPRENWDEVKDVSTSMQLIAVDSFEGAVSALRK